MIQKRIIKNQKQESHSKQYYTLKQKIVQKTLGRKDSNLRIAGPKPVALPLGHAPFRSLFDTNKH